MTGRGNIFRRFVASRRAVAGIEFAMILPLLLALLLGFFDAGTAVAIYTKTRFATSTLAELTNQYTTIHDADMTQILGATSVVLAPYSSTPVTTSISQIAISATGAATVSWSNTLTPGKSFPLPANLAVKSSYLIYAQVSYTYTPAFSYFLSGPITLSDNLYVSPRNSASITRVSP
jgi:Flp pilus assembly protein TadG